MGIKIIKRVKWGFGIVIFLCLVLPWAFTSNYTGIDFSKSGQIGDTIAGITSPIIGLFAAFLVYLSFEQQRLANQFLSKESTYNYITKRLNNVKDKYNNYAKKERSVVASFCEIIEIKANKLVDSGYYYDKLPETDAVFESIEQRRRVIAFGANSLYSNIQKLYKIASNYVAFTDELLEKNQNVSRPLKLEIFLEIENDIELIIKGSNRITFLIDEWASSKTKKLNNNIILTALGKLETKLERLYVNSIKLKALDK